MFETAAIPTGGAGQRIWATGMGIAGQTLLMACAIAIPLLSPSVLPRPQAILGWLQAPAPPPPEPPKAEIQPSLIRTVPPLMKEGVLQAPSRVPIGVPIIEDPPLPPGMSLDSVFRGQRMGDVFADAAPQTVIAPPVAPAVERPAEAAPPVIKRYRPGGNIVAAVPIRRVEPVYPQIAIQARISGKVELEAVIGIDGRIHELRALSGPPLLIPAAVNAVKEWLYKPYLLNGDPIEVVQSIIVTFNLK